MAAVVKPATVLPDCAMNPHATPATPAASTAKKILAHFGFRVAYFDTSHHAANAASTNQSIANTCGTAPAPNFHASPISPAGRSTASSVVAQFRQSPK